MRSFLIYLVLLFSLNSYSYDFESEVLAGEFNTLLSLVQGLEPEFVVGGYLNGKKYGDVELLWNLAKEPDDYDVIRIYHNHGDGSSFDVSFYRGTHLVKGKRMLRRFVGPTISGWRNDSVDLDIGEYLGSQGVAQPLLTDRDREILNTWNIYLFGT